MKRIVVTGGFDDLRSNHIRFLEEASNLGELVVSLWTDETIETIASAQPKFPLSERLFMLNAIRYIADVRVIDGVANRDSIPDLSEIRPNVWVVHERDDCAAKRTFSETHGIEYRVLTSKDLNGFPAAGPEMVEPASSRKKVIVTGCYDWFHSGHVRFFEEVSELGDLHVVVGHDENIRLLKGEGHPMFPQDERRYVVGAVRFVKQCTISSGHGWLDAEPEIARIRPDVYAVNEDGDVPEKRAFCQRNGIEYVVLKRTPKEGLPKRESTNLRGF